MFDKETIEALKAPLAHSAVKQRDQGKQKVSYIEGWHAIAEANRIFGFDGWARETVKIKCVAEGPKTIAKGKQWEHEGHGVTYTAKVRVIVGPTGEEVVREGVGAGHGIDSDLGQAHESAIKEAETDAMKRALMTFGNPFGLALYDKSQKNVAKGTKPPARPPQQPKAPPPSSEIKIELPKEPGLIQVPPPQNGDMGKIWQAWCTTFANAINEASSVDQVNSWMFANEAPLKNLAAFSDKGKDWANALHDRMDKRRGMLFQEPNE